MALTCGQGGSNGAEIVGDINANTNGVADLDTRVTAIENLPSASAFYGIKLAAYAVPDAYAGPAVTLTAVGILAGRYLISYSMQLNFNTEKDKEIAYQITGDIAGDELAQSQSLASTVGKKSVDYSYYIDLPAGDFTYGIQFRDVTTGRNLLVDFCDLMLDRVGDTPIP